MKQSIIKGADMNTERMAELRKEWEAEEKIAHIHGWDFSHIDGRYDETPLPWDYREIALDGLKPCHRLLDMGTGGGEFMLGLGHPLELVFVFFLSLLGDLLGN